MKEKVIRSLPGMPVLLVLLLATLACSAMALDGIAGQSPWPAAAMP